jgi:ATP-dependent Lon protease
MIRKNSRQGDSKKELPLVPMRELVIYPHMVIPFFAGRGGSIKAIEEAMMGERIVFLACQKNPVDEPEIEDLYGVGCAAKVVQMLKLPDGTIRVLAEGKQRGEILKIHKKKEISVVTVRIFEENTEVTPEIAALMSAILDSFKRYAALNKKVSQESLGAIEKAEYPHKLADLVCGAVSFRTEKKAELLGIEDPLSRLETLAVYLEAENEILGLQSKINAKVKKRLEKNQREYYLSEQLKEINKELGREDADATGVKEFRDKMARKNLPAEVLEKTEREIGRLSKLQPMSPESGILRTYIEWILDLPWNERTQDNKDITKAATILDEDHFDLKKPKERILDFIAVRQLKESLKGPILCFVGPPGTGKTSLAVRSGL